MKNKVRNDVAKRPKLPKPAAPVRAWGFVSEFTNPEKREGPPWICGFSVKDTKAEALEELVNGGWGPSWSVIPVLILDPRTHRAVPLKRKGRK